MVFFYSHFIISLRSYDMVATTFLYIIILCYVKNPTIQCQFCREVGPTQKNETYSRDFFFSANIIPQVVDFLF
jgi:hypothetical protein